MSSPVFNEDTIRAMERGGSFRYDEHGNPIASDAGLGMGSAQPYSINVTKPATFSINGAIIKTGYLLSLVIISAIFGALFVPQSLYMPILIGVFIATIGLALWIAKSPKQAMVLGSVYAVIEGVMVGMFSMVMAQSFGLGIILQALLATVAVTVGMLALYATRIIKVTQKFRSIVVGATAGVFLLYIFAFIGRVVFGAQLDFFFGNGLLSIGISLGIIAIAAFNLMLDFDLFETMQNQQVAKYYEWYAAFGLMVTLVWLYIEILRLLAKIQSRD